ncbi:MAG: hypothetical protein M1320_00620 [Patescibacteria group bacterium]|nr:hypothetical protein [Patescibacteria group bacterium]
MEKELIGKIAGIFATLGFLPYLISVLRGKKPSKASWILWSVLGIALGLSYKSAGANASIWVPVSYAICPLLILGATFYKDRSSMEKWPTIDKLSLWAGLACFIPWIIFKVFEYNGTIFGWLPLITLYGGIIIDGWGAVPTIIKSYKDPENESWLGWIFWGIGNVLNLFAIESWDLNISAYVIYMVIPSLLIIPPVSVYNLRKFFS